MRHTLRKIAATLCLALGATAANAENTATPHNESRFGINGTKIFHIPDKIDTKVQERFALMHELGVSWDRIDLWWHVVQPEPDRWDFSWPDRVFDEFERHGVQWYPILCYGAAWWGGRSGPQSEEEVDQYVEYVRRTVERYKDRATYWSIWNEPNIPEYWSPEVNPDLYFYMLRESYKAIKEIDPSLQVNAFSLAPLGQWDRGFTERVFQLGGADYFDVFDYHFYRTYPPEGELPNEIAEINAVMARYGEIRPIWISESGVTTIQGPQDEAYARQARLAVRGQLLSFGLGVERFFYFDLQNWTDEDDGEWGAKLGLVEDGGTRKPAFTAYKTMIEQVDFHDIPGRVTTLGDGIEALLLREPQSDVYKLALWSTTGPQDVTILAEPTEVLVVSLMGEETRHAFEAEENEEHAPRELTLTLDEDPIYVHSVHAPAYLPHAGVGLSQDLVIAAPGEELQLRVAIDALLEGASFEVHNLETPSGISWDPLAGSLTVSDAAAPGRHALAAELEVSYTLHETEHSERVGVRGEVEVVEVAELRLRPYYRNGRVEVDVRIVNHSRNALEEDLRFVQVDADGREFVLGQEAMFSVGPGAVAEYSFRIRDAQLDRITEPVEWKLTYGVFESRPMRIAIARLSDSGPEIDGDLSEWEGIPSIALDRESQVIRRVGEWTPERASATAQFWFTDEAMYLAARITDNSPMDNPNPPIQMWRGDALEWYVGFGGPTRRTVLERELDYQIGIAARAEGHDEPVAFLFHHDVLIEDATIAAVETDDGYLIEARIPYDALRLPEPPSLEAGMLLGLDLALDDYDAGEIAPEGNIPGRALMWSGTGMNWIDPSNWGMAILREE